MAILDIKRGHTVLFGLVLVVGFIEAVISTHMVLLFEEFGYPYSSLSPYRSPPDRFIYLLFVAWWIATFSAVYIAVFLFAPKSRFASIASHGVWIAVTWILWLVAIANITSYLTGHAKGGMRPSLNDSRYKHLLKSMMAFGWIEFVSLSALLVYISLIGWKTYRKGERLSGSLV